MKNPPMKHIADKLATHGRYGDTMLVHMNPREVEGIASLVPGGKLTINPVTGQPEAFLPFLVPILGSMLGSAAAGAGMLGGLGTLAGSAIGSGLATTLATGDLEQGLISGITGFGLGSALQGLGAAAGAAGDIAKTGTAVAPTAVADAAQAAIPEAVQAAGTAGTAGGIGAFAPPPTGAEAFAQPQQFTGMGNIDFTKVPGATNYVAPPANNMGLDFNSIASKGAQPGYFQGLQDTATGTPNTFGNNLMAPIREPGQFLKNLTKPEAFLPMYVGEGTNASIRAQKEMEESGLNFKREQEKEGSMAREGILRALERVRSDYGMFAGGQVDYAGGGTIESVTKALKGKTTEPDYGAYVNQLYGTYGSPSGIQSSLRGTELNTPPAFDYNALYSGGSGYAPGVAPEFMFFGQKAPSTGGGTGIVTPPTGGGGTGGTGTGIGGGTDFNLADIIDSINTEPTGGVFSGGNFTGPIYNDGYFETAPSIQPADGGGGLSGSIGPSYDYLNGQPSSDTTLGTDIGSVISGGSSFDNPYQPSNQFGQTDIISFIDSLSPTEDNYWAEQIEAMPVQQFDINDSLINSNLLQNSFQNQENFSTNPYLADMFAPNEDSYWSEELEKQPIRMFAEGGPVDPAVEATVNPFQGEYDNLVQSTIAAIKGEIENPEPIINQFVQEYGNEAFMQLREQVLQSVQPGAQTQGLVDGPGGGMDDMVQGSISDGRPVAVSPGEYIVPADVVSAAGDGNTGGGAKFFDDLIESIRVSKNGTSEQPKPMKEIMG